ncbi:hypothetical protein ABEF89_14825 (plasmid) [Acinetobacter thermotolerans]|uniref:hypothetical protein n=1 Tax=Acinetobacter thermotolerans TaxID=3151487 RepID=UPI00325AED95
MTNTIDLEEVSDVKNPGSALGEAIGHLMEEALAEYITPLVLDHSCKLITTGPYNKKTKKYTKLLLTDSYGTDYSIDGVIINERSQPVILLESKYIRYKKHNRDKGSWICHAHGSIRNRYNSVRSCIAILAGSWSKTSLRMMASHNINIFHIPFENIAVILEKYNINFRWGEKERHIAADAWNKFINLTPEQHLEIGTSLIQPVLEELKNRIDETLSDETPRAIEQVMIEIKTTLGEIKRFFFKDRESALDFLDDFTFDEIMDHASSFTIFDKPIIEEEDEEV